MYNFIRTVKTYNLYNLGDNLVFLNYIYRLALENKGISFIHYLNSKYVNELKELFSLKNIQLVGINTPNKNGFFELPPYSNIELYNSYTEKILQTNIPEYKNCINSWIGDENFFFTHNLKNDWVLFHIDYFKKISRKMYLTNPIKSKEDLLFNIKHLNDNNKYSNLDLDFLIINSRPLSGQILNYDKHFFENINTRLVKKGYKTILINSDDNSINKYSLLDIALISKKAKYIIGIPNGPMWLTFNKFTCNNVNFRLVQLNDQILELGKNCYTLKSEKQIFNYLRDNGFIKKYFFI